MKNNNIFKLFVSYIKGHLKLIMAYCIIFAVFGTVISLHNLPVGPVFYGMILCSSIGLLFVFQDFHKFYQHHFLLCQLRNQISLDIDNLPVPITLIEADYKELISILYRDKMSDNMTFELQYKEIQEYLLLWAHQIKTPISAIRILLQADKAPQSTDLLLELFKIEQYVEMVLQYLRLDDMSSDLILQKYSLDDLVKQAVRKYSKMFIGKKIQLNYSPLHCEVLTDEKWLVFVIEQILSNSLKYTPKGSISIYIDEFLSKTLVIEDTGIGIQEEDLPRVFEKGFTGYNGHNDKKSTGIGLYLCKRILNKLSHTISIESSVGNGTRVLINLATVDIYPE